MVSNADEALLGSGGFARNFRDRFDSGRRGTARNDRRELPESFRMMTRVGKDGSRFVRFIRTPMICSRSTWVTRITLVKLRNSIFAIGSVFASLLVSGSVLAQAESSIVPGNAMADRFGSGWRCDSGFRKLDDQCIRIEVPNNAYLTGFGSSNEWECSYGFVQTNGRCEPLVVPLNAYIDSSGERWRCARGFTAESGRCDPVPVPVNGYLNRFGDGWTCLVGFRATGDTCEAVSVPENAYSTNSTYGSGWECRYGYRPSSEACEPVVVPDNAFYVDRTSSRSWDCKRGFKQVNESCEAVVLPDNAHLSYSGSDWDCNKPYRKRADGCVLLEN